MKQPLDAPSQPKSSPKNNKIRFRFRRRDFLFVIIGVLLAFLLRFALIDSHTVHYHASFALYINGQRETFDSFAFYEEIASCSAQDDMNPRARVHLHNQVNDLVHVHASGVTWGHFFANLGFVLGNDLIKTDQGLYEDGKNGKLRFILNDTVVSSVANRAVESEDRLLIDFGTDTNEVLMDRFKNIRTDAHEYNHKPDPSSCSGGDSETLRDRFLRTLGIDHQSHEPAEKSHSH